MADGDLLILRARSATAPSARSAAADASSSSQQPNEEALIEQLRQQVLADPNMMAQLRQSNPPLAEAARSSSSEFARLMGEYRRHMASVQQQRMQAEAELASADEFDIDAQRRIEEAIQQENVLANLEHAMEYNPESFGRVNMLYVMTEINGVEVKAFVDSGAQATIMSPDCAERCGIMRLLDRRFAGIARGVGTAKILGRIHSAQIKLSDKLFLPCSFTVMEGKGVECLFGGWRRACWRMSTIYKCIHRLICLSPPLCLSYRARPGHAEAVPGVHRPQGQCAHHQRRALSLPRRARAARQRKGAGER